MAEPELASAKAPKSSSSSSSLSLCEQRLVCCAAPLLRAAVCCLGLDMLSTMHAWSAAQALHVLCQYCSPVVGSQKVIIAVVATWLLAAAVDMPSMPV